MTRQEVFNLRKIKNTSDIPTAATYFENRYDEEARTTYIVLYNSNFEEIENVYVIYTSAFNNLSRIVKEEHKNNLALFAYDLEDLHNGFYLVKKNEETSQGLRSTCKSLID